MPGNLSETSEGVQGIVLSDALTRWKAPHPAWMPNPEWPEQVAFATWQSPDSFVFIDPLVRDDLDPAAWQPFDRAVSESGLPAVVLLTAPWHERSLRAVAARYGAAVWIHPLGRARIGELPELSALPAGVDALEFDGVDEGQVAFHVVPEQALVVAEFFVGTGNGLRVLPSPATRDMAAFAASLEQLRDLRIERVLVAHGAPVLADGTEAIRDALDAFAINRQ
jgi:glyoxylase-like metal-dependent hydrolase (beta-lactamase superfamily II)